MTTRARFGLVLGLLLAAPVRGAAQEAPPPPRIGLVLSGGSAKGFAHIGVLRVLEEAGIPIDVVTGASMGGLVGALYAIGNGPDELETIARTLAWDQLFSDPGGPAFFDASGHAVSPVALIAFPLQDGRVQLPSGLIAGQQISRALARLTWPALGITDFRSLPIPFAAVATDLETGEAVVLNRGSLPLALRASMSLPGIFRPVMVDGRLLVDGGLVRNLPSQDARDLGAEIVICSDVSEPPLAAARLRSFLDVLLQTLSFQMDASTSAQRALCDVVIRPDIDNLSSTAFDQAGAWIARGEQAARSMLDDLSRVSAPAGRRPAPARPRAPDARHIDAVAIRGLDDEGRAFAERVLDLTGPAAITVDGLDAAIDRLYRTGAFDRVSYRVEQTAASATLVIDAVKRAADSIGFGFRYDSRFNASLLFDATFHNLGRMGSTTQVALHLGEQFELSGQHLFHAGSASGLVTGVGASYVETPIGVFDGDARVAEIRVDATNVAAFAGARLGRHVLASVRLAGEVARGDTRVAAVESDEVRAFYTAAGTLSVDTFNRRAFPTSGVRLLARSEGAFRAIGSGGDFWTHLVDAHAAVPLARRLTWQTRAIAGAAGGADLPFHYQFFLGGTIESSVFAERQPVFPGLRAQERTGRAVQMFQTGLQFEPATQVFLTLRAHVGNTANAWRLRFGEYVHGYEATAGLTTLLGPLEVVVSGRKLSGQPRIEVRLGYGF